MATVQLPEGMKNDMRYPAKVMGLIALIMKQ
jgi:hypothetical protein